MGSSGILGMALGAISGGKIVKVGWKKSYLIGCFIGLIGVGISVIETIPTILVGRLIFGFACGIHSISVPRYMEEVIPNNIYPIFSPIFMCS